MNLLPHISGPAALFWGVLTFSLLVIIHEGGHFIAARAFGIRVHEFMIGLPGPALRHRSKRTGIAYGVTAVPLGGYVRIAGMEPGEEDPLLAEALAAVSETGVMTTVALARALRISRDRASTLLTTLIDYGAVEELADGQGHSALVTREETEDAPQALDRIRARTYRGLPTWKRIVVLSTGVLFNLLTAVLIFTVTLTVWGYMVPSPTLDSILKGSAAAEAGLRPGDTILQVDRARVTDWEGLLASIAARHPGDTVVLTVARQAERLRLTARLGSRRGGAFLGVGPRLVQRRLAPHVALWESLRWTGLVFVAIARFFDPRTFSAAVGDARSVVGISYEVADAARRGPIDYAWIVALLSLSLGVMNILPIPPLDGGKVALEMVERFRRRPMRRETSLAISAVGAVLLFSLIFYLMYADVMRYIVKG